MMARKTFKKVITNDKLIEQFNPENVKLVNRFIKDKNMKCSEGTINGYKSDLNIFFTWNLLHNDNKFFVDIRKIEFSDFFSYGVEELQWSPKRFGRMKSCLSSFSNFIENYFDDIYPNFRNLILKSIENLKSNPVREKTILLEEQIDGLLNHLLENGKAQEACLLALAANSGARVSELMRFTTTLIDENNLAFDDMFLETTKQIKTKGFGKQGKLLHKYILKDKFLPYYHAWLPIRDEIMKKNNKDHDALFVKSNGEPAQVSTARSWSIKWEEYLGVPFYFHSLRHYLVTNLTRIGLESEFIIELVGWTSTDMYRIYNDLTAKEKKWKGLSKLKKALGTENEDDGKEENNEG
ncbi:site-specific tyrosine recombinase XerC [compost metagenome]